MSVQGGCSISGEAGTELAQPWSLSRALPVKCTLLLWNTVYCDTKCHEKVAIFTEGCIGGKDVKCVARRSSWAQHCYPNVFNICY